MQQNSHSGMVVRESYVSATKLTQARSVPRNFLIMIDFRIVGSSETIQKRRARKMIATAGSFGRLSPPTRQADILCCVRLQVLRGKDLGKKSRSQDVNQDAQNQQAVYFCTFS